MAVLVARVHREREREAAQVERARMRVAEVRDAEATVLPTAESVAQVVRGALAGHLGMILTVRIGSPSRGQTVEIRLVTLCRAGVLCRTERGCPVWLSYRDLYAAHATVLAPVHVHGAVQRAVARLRRAAPTPKGGA